VKIITAAAKDSPVYASVSASGPLELVTIRVFYYYDLTSMEPALRTVLATPADDKTDD
jgi:hypothetical protein